VRSCRAKGETSQNRRYRPKPKMRRLAALKQLRPLPYQNHRECPLRPPSCPLAPYSGTQRVLDCASSALFGHYAPTAHETQNNKNDTSLCYIARYKEQGAIDTTQETLRNLQATPNKRHRTRNTNHNTRNKRQNTRYKTPHTIHATPDTTQHTGQGTLDTIPMTSDNEPNAKNTGQDTGNRTHAKRKYEGDCDHDAERWGR
jgi:hypothetical protein